ncbi:MAG: TIR domain-containing protein [Rhizobiaceae bacterium]
MALGTPSQQKLVSKFFDPFFNWDDDEKLRAWLAQQDADELEQFLNWFNFDGRRDREELGRQELKKLRDPKAKLPKLLSEGRALLDKGEPVEAHSAFGRWVNAVARWLENDLNEPSLSAIWSGLPQSMLVRGGSYYDFPDVWDQFQRAVSKRLRWLGEAASSRGDQATSLEQQSSLRQQSRKVFIVHGHDDACRESVARFLTNIDFMPVILHEQANRGKTLIKKFETHSDVGFAVILLTADDIGSAVAATEQRHRARQNVVLEWGYFIGRLGRSNVCALMKGVLELPSDILGIVWEPLDDPGAWKNKLAKELEESGYDVDWKKVGRS